MANTDTTPKKTIRPSKFYPEGQKPRGTGITTGTPISNPATTAASNGRLYDAGKVVGNFLRNGVEKFNSLQVPSVIKNGLGARGAPIIPAALGTAQAGTAADRFDADRSLNAPEVDFIKNAQMVGIVPTDNGGQEDTNTGDYYDEFSVEPVVQARLKDLYTVPGLDEMSRARAERNLRSPMIEPQTVKTVVVPENTPEVQAEVKPKATKKSTQSVQLGNISSISNPSNGLTSFNQNDLMPLLALAAAGYAGYRIGR